MTCLCGRYLGPDGPELCPSCGDSRRSVLNPIGELAALMERTSLEDWALFCIALNRKAREEQDARAAAENGD